MGPAKGWSLPKSFDSSDSLSVSHTNTDSYADLVIHLQSIFLQHMQAFLFRYMQGAIIGVHLFVFLQACME